MGRHPKSGHVDADDANTIDFFRKYLQRHARGRGHAEVDHHDRVVQGRVRELEDGLTDVLKQFAGHQGLRIERHVTDAPARAIKVGRERQAIDAAG